MKKPVKLALLITIWSTEYLQAVLDGIIERIKDVDVRVDVYVGFDIDEWDGMSFTKEREFFSIVNPASYDGALVAVGGFNYLEAVQKAAKRFTDSGVPVVAVETPIDDAAIVKVDNYDAFYDVTEHILRDHGCKTLNYVGGPEGAPDALVRQKAFEDCCRKYNIPAENIHEKFYAYIFEDGKQAYQDFKAEGLHIPDAVICANDGMARGYCEAAIEDGFQAPSDFFITGFDNDSLSRNYIPSITTVDVNLTDSACSATDLLLKKIDGIDIPKEKKTKAKVICGQSCGCIPINSFSREKILTLQKGQEIFDNLSLGNRLALQTLADSADLLTLQHNLTTYSHHFDTKHIGIALNNRVLNGNLEDDSEGYDEEMVMVTKTGIFNINRLDDIYPDFAEEKEDSQIFLVCPLYYNTDTFGYAAYAYSDRVLGTIERRAAGGFLSIAIASLRQKIALQVMNEEIQKMNYILKDLSVTDSLTGLYNRLAYSQMGRDFYEKHKGNVFFLYIDMDYLKKINDSLGHDVGNVALIAIADGIKHTFPETDLRIRMGGDEFLVIGVLESEEKLIEQIKALEQFLDKRGQEEKLPVPLSASMGYVLGNDSEECDDFEEMVKKSDARMYAIKQEKKRCRE